MNKKMDITRILTKGSAKQRALLYFNDVTEKEHEEKGFLTELEQKQLFDSFKTDAEGKLYNNFLHIKRGLYNGLMVLKQGQFQYRETIATLTGFCLLYDAYEDFAETLKALYSSMKTTGQKKKLLEVIKKNQPYLFANIGPTEDLEKDGFTVQPNKIQDEPDIEAMLSDLSKKATKQLQYAKTVVKAIRDHMEETGLEIQLFKTWLESVDQDLRTDKAPLQKFSRKQSIDLLLNITADPEQRRRIEETVNPHWLYPEYEKIEIDKAVYEHMRKEGGVM